MADKKTDVEDMDDISPDAEISTDSEGDGEGEVEIPQVDAIKAESGETVTNDDILAVIE